jgi:plasmid stabilization system protein ParE
LEFTLIIHELAVEDILEIAYWYDLQMPGLGNRFENYLDECFSKIQKNPDANNRATLTTRKAYLKKFPYIVFFEIKGDNIHIYGVIHSKRNPIFIKKRFQSIFKRK